MDITRRDLLKLASMTAVAAAVNPGMSFPGDKVPDIGPEDRVFIANEDSNTITVIDPRTNTVETTINFTSFDEDPRPPFRFVTGGVTPTQKAEIAKYANCAKRGRCRSGRREQVGGKSLEVADLV